MFASLSSDKCDCQKFLATSYVVVDGRPTTRHTLSLRNEFYLFRLPSFFISQYRENVLCIFAVENGEVGLITQHICTPTQNAIAH